MRFVFTLLNLSLLTLFLLSSCKKPSEPTASLIITIDPKSLTITNHPAYLFPLTVKVNNTAVAASDIRWVSADTTIAIVDARGFVHGTGTGGGQTEIIAELKSGQGSVSCSVIVTDSKAYKFRLFLKDKGISSYSVNRPEEFLSAKAISRRRKQNIAVNETDLPLSSDYIRQIQNVGGVVVAQSKWLNTVSVYCTNGKLLAAYKQLPFVKDAVVVWQGEKVTPSTSSGNSTLTRTGTGAGTSTRDSAFYGAAWQNMVVENGAYLHQQGYEGEGIDIALIDAGFIDLPNNPAFSNTNIRGAKSFIYEDANPYATDDHGVWTSSCMAVNKPGFFVGTAPLANYWFLRTEDRESEFPIEEDYMISAMEFADSAGVDVINTSLYYTSHDGYTYNYRYEDMDGKTAFATKGANMAADKGMLIVCCAGNTQSWVGAPTDSPKVLAIGSVNRLYTISTFSSFGLTVDGRIKPDLVGLGEQAGVITTNGTFMKRSGTSYASPIICGLAACLWAGYPKLNNEEIRDVMKKASDRYNNPALPYGYGIPDMQKAMQLAQTLSDSK